MDNVELVSNVHGIIAGNHDLRVHTSTDRPLTFDDLHELHLTSIEAVVGILQKYAEIKVPKDPGNVFLEQLTQRLDAWFIEAGDVGLIYLTNIIPNNSGILNVLFWDQKLGDDREILVQGVLQEAFRLFSLQRVSAFTVYANKPFQKFLSRVGFRAEGLVRKGRLVDDTFVDVALFGLIEEDMQSWLLPTISLGL